MIDWPSARVLVTGGHGFLGSHVLDRLDARGAKPFTPRSRDCNLVDGEAVRRLLRDTKPDVVIHLAARVGGIGANNANPARFYYENLMMGTQVMHESWRMGVSKLVSVATICAYPKLCPVPFKEDDLWNGYPEETNAPYGIAKKVLSVQSAAYRQQYGFNSCVVYPVNLYGPRDNFDLSSSHVIPAMMRKMHEAKVAKRKAVVLWGDGTPTREFLYVKDCAEAVVLAAEKYDSSEPVNIGSGVEVRIDVLAAKVAGFVGFDGEFLWDMSKPNGQPRRRLDTERARRKIGYAATTSLDDGLRLTYDWVQHQAGLDGPHGMQPA
jgi:GDP-L-fucose synthase